MSRRLMGLLVKETIQFLRDRVLLILILWLYTVEVVICALALSFEIEAMPLAIVDLDSSPASRELGRQFSVTDAFTTVGHLDDADEAAGWLRSGRARIALIVPSGFQQDLARDAVPNVQILVDGTNSNIAAQARSAALEIVNRFWVSQSGDNAMPSVGTVPVIRLWYNPDGTYTPFVVLSMIALAALMVGVIHPAASIVRERETGTIEQLRVTPIRVGELFLAKTFPTLAMGLASIFPSLVIVWWFDVPFRGSLTLFLALSALFLLSAIALGVLVASVSRTLQQALLLSFFGLFPLMFLSGTIVPVESMPDILQDVSLASPLRHYMDVILGIFLKGTGLRELWPQTLALLLIGSILFVVAAQIFRRSSR